MRSDIQVRRIARLNYGDALNPEHEGRGDVPVYGSNGVYSAAETANTLAPAIIVGRKGSFGKINWTNVPCWASDTTFFIDQRSTDSDLRWLYYALQTLGLDEASGEAAVPGINREKVYEHRLPVLDVKQQRNIASYLDDRTRELDDLIEQKKRLLQLLTEKRRALITHVVTRGLNPNVSYRDSGIPWLSEIPAHWETSRVAWLFDERDERNQSDLPLLEVSIHGGVRLREFSEERIEQVAEDFNSYKVARTGDISFNKMRMWQGAVGKVPCDGLVSPDYVVAQPSENLDSGYFGLLFRTSAFSAEAGSRSHGIVWDRLRLYWEEFRDISVPVPPLDEQERIIAHV